ncbi:RusA family crossover junction endodeoxyribonuclease [Maridesulfovibrio sp.]|uniref:RusA family crossover junction endodeoxyribonuclease n=1 Tax=Maridesulfovibrio sp. TaxID=2795000 RepID=UPI0029CA62C7|nr:RusA family crossover junction endodeoxyribonuclease [Maridesulfovibrio sp.]
MQVLKFTIPITPVAQKRARHAVRGKHACAYKHKDQRSAEQVLNTFLKDFQPTQPLTGPLVLGVRAFLPIPKSKPKKFKAAAQAGEIRPIVKPDMDNVLKHIKDCMSQMRYWGDDKQVVEYLPGTGKYYSDQPRWEIELRPWVPDMKPLEEA